MTPDHYNGYPNPYQGPPGYPPPYHRPTNTMAILAIVFAFVFSPLGIVFGHIAKKQIAQTGEDGETLATVGMVIGYVSVGILVCVCGAYGVFFAGWFALLFGAGAAGAGG